MKCNCQGINKIDELNAVYLHAEIAARDAQLKLLYALVDNYRDLIKKIDNK
jgi:hypothetical protein